MCPYCGNPISRVIATENYGTWIRRRRRCVKCGGTYYGKEEFDGIIKPPPNYQPSPTQQ